MKIIMTYKQKATPEAGFASLVIGLVLIVVIGLLTVSFAQLTRHEQQQALDKQLATQAYYAAESGINDAVQAIDSGAISPAIASTYQNKCLPNSIPGLTGSIPGSSNVSYSCVMVDLSTDKLFYGGVEPDASHTVITDSTPALTTLTITWNVPAPAASPVSGLPGNFDTFDNWNNNNDYPGVIQFSITPLGPSNFDRNTLLNKTFTVFLYPAKASKNNPVHYNVNPSGTISSDCIVNKTCSVTIDNLGASPGPYLIHFVNYYHKTDVTITGNGGTAIFSGGQATVDVTGKAKDVLKRLRVGVPLQEFQGLSNYAIEAGNLCKRMQTEPGATHYIEFDGSQANGTTSPCDLSN